MKAMTFDKSFAEKTDTFANLIANLSRMVLTTSERLFYIKLLTRGFRSTPIYPSNLEFQDELWINLVAGGHNELPGPRSCDHLRHKPRLTWQVVHTNLCTGHLVVTLKVNIKSDS